MQPAIGMSLQGLQQTLILPLWGRYTESSREGGLIKDEECIRIVGDLHLEFSALERRQHPASRLAWVARAWNLDRELRRLIASGPATVVCLGAGLDTAYYRLGRPADVTWYDIDLPEVSDLRRRVMGDEERVTIIGGSVLEGETYRLIRVVGSSIVVAVGLLYYFDQEGVRTVFDHISTLASRAIVVIDYCSRLGVAAANELVLGDSEQTRMTWSADSDEELRAVCPSMCRLETYPLFSRILPLLAGQDKQMAIKSDENRIMSFAIMELAKETRPAPADPLQAARERLAGPGIMDNGMRG